MEIKHIMCELLKIEKMEIGCQLVLQNISTENKYIVIVDESLERVKKRLKEQYLGNTSKEGVYLSRSMTNIDINTVNDDWYIDEEGTEIYHFNKEDVKKVLEL